MVEYDLPPEQACDYHTDTRLPAVTLHDEPSDLDEPIDWAAYERLCWHVPRRIDQPSAPRPRPRVNRRQPRNQRMNRKGRIV